MSDRGNVEKMYVAESFFLRASIVLGMVAAVVTILYFSPMPEYLSKSCDRPCHDLDWPMICRVRLTIDASKISRNDCINNNQTDCVDTSKGILTGSLSTSKLLPGPSIQVCQNDVLVVDIINKLPGHGLAIHWRGQPQNEAPFMDGVPMVTQCPINSYTTFQYKFRASVAGTHLWHAHSGVELADGIFGALIVRRAPKLDPQRKMYDYDEKKHVMLISEWSGSSVTNLSSYIQKPKKLLINGKSSDVPYNFEVKHGKRYRFRVAFGGGISECPIRLSIDQHQIKIISLDGTPIVPYQADAFDMIKGERVDFVLKANQEYNKYQIKVASVCDEEKLEAAAVVTYVGGTHASRKSGKREASVNKVFTTLPCHSNGEVSCLGDVHSVKKMTKVLKTDVQRKLYYALDFVDNQDSNKVYRMNNITFMYPPSPLLTQMNDVPFETICNADKFPDKCLDLDTCECTHVENIVLGSTVEIVLIDGGAGGLENNFHLHGYQFYMVGSRIFDKPVSLEEIKRLDEQNLLLKRNLVSPVQKDTIRIPKNGVVALRFVANNPGFWMLRDGNANKWTRGADIVFHVGSLGDIPSTPSSFPTCGSYVGPEFFFS